MFQPIILQHFPDYSSLFKFIPSYTCLFNFIPAYSSQFYTIQAGKLLYPDTSTKTRRGFGESILNVSININNIFLVKKCVQKLCRQGAQYLCLYTSNTYGEHIFSFIFFVLITSWTEKFTFLEFRCFQLMKYLHQIAS